MEKRLDLVGIGECLVEFSAAGDGLYQLGYSGDVLNALACAHRLGLTTGLITAVGDDAFLPGLREVLLDEHIDLSHAPVLEGKSNGVYFIDLDEHQVPSYHFLRKDSAATETFRSQPLEELIGYAREARALLFSSIPLAVMKDREKLFDLLTAIKGETHICYDLNVRRVLWPDPTELIAMMRTLAPIVDVIFVTNDDDRFLFGERSPEQALIEYQKCGFQRVIFRRGAEKTLVADDGESFAVPVPRATHIIDTTGAGDAFNAGFIAAMLRRHPSYECAAMGNAAAACSIESRGGRGTGISIERVEKLYRPLVKWGTFHVPPRR
jgi:2-dehydro-3-deoxygluconokinase